MRKYKVLFCLQLLFSISSNAQKVSRVDTMYQHIFVPIGDVAGFVNCAPATLSGCNYVFNPELATNAMYNGDPWLVFNNTYIDNWANSHGTPNIEDVNNNPTGPPFSGTHGAYMEFRTEAGGEGLAGKLKPLTPNKPYSLSFFQNHPSVSGASLREYDIYLMHCSDAPQYFHPNTYVLPTAPPHSKQIYCQQNFPVTAGWSQVAIDFTPDENYDMIWIFPRITPSQSSPEVLYVGFSYPEIISNETFSAGPQPNPTPGNCTVTIGPATPNCGVKNAVFTWHGPNNQTIPAPANQQIQVDAGNSNNVGNWTLTMTVPYSNAYGTNSCSNALNVQASVYVPSCQCSDAQILPTSFFYWGNNPHQSIISNSLNVFCVPWEDQRILELFTNNASNNLWYIDDVPIPVTGMYPNNIGWVNIDNNTSQLSYSGVGGKRYKFQVKNLSSGCTALSPATYIEAITRPYPNNRIGFYKPNFNLHISVFPLSQSTYGEVYTWNIPGTVITNLNPSTGDADVYFPSTIPLPTVTGTLNISSNQPYCNGDYNIYFEYKPNLFSEVTASDKSIKQVYINIYPNPASNQITITSNEAINYIEISDLMNPVLKRIKLNNTKSIIVNVSDLNPGIYNCKITSSKGTENQKLIIRR